MEYDTDVSCEKSDKKRAVISARNLKKSFTNQDTELVIFDNLDLDIYKEDFTVIMGSSGAGKSTLMYLLSGMDRPTKGEITFCGKNITDLSDNKLKSDRMQSVKNDLAKKKRIKKILAYTVDTVNVEKGSIKAFVCHYQSRKYHRIR